MPRRASPKAGSLSAEGVVNICTQLIFLEDSNLVEEARQELHLGGYGEEFNNKYGDVIERIMKFIYDELSISLNYDLRPDERDAVLEISQYPEGRPWPAKPADVINHIIDLLNVDAETLKQARQVTPVMPLDEPIGQLIGLVLASQQRSRAQVQPGARQPFPFGPNAQAALE